MTYQKLSEDLIKEWNWKKNVGLDPRNLNVKAKTILWWICDKGHEWPARLDHRKRGSGCPYDSGQRLLTSNSLANTYPEIANQWHPHKNGEITSNDISRATTKVFWWMCPNGHEWPASVSNRSRRDDSCPYCNGKRVYNGNCLATIKPEIAELWHPTKNGKLTPFDVTSCSGKVV